MHRLRPTPIQRLGLACIPEQWRMAGRRVFFPTSPMSYFSSRPVALLRLATEDCISRATYNLGLCARGEEIQESSSYQRHRPQSVCGQVKQNRAIKFMRGLSRECTWSCPPVLSRFFPSPVPSVLFDRVGRVGPGISKFPSCSGTSILNTVAQQRNVCCRLSRGRRT